MSRPLRLEYPGAWYHVMNRGRGRQPIFTDERHYRAFLDILADAHHRFALEVHAYCLMGNHYHLLVRTPEGNLSRAMRHVNGVYTQHFNRLGETDGPLFRGRYKAIVVDADSYLLSVSRYIHRNPIDGSQPLVDSLAVYPWSSYPAYINRIAAPEWLYRRTTYDVLGRRDCYRGYRSHVERPVEQDVQDYYNRARQAPILGPADFRRQVLVRAGVGSEVAGWEVDAPARQDVDTIVAIVARACGMKPAGLYARPGRGRGARAPERALAMRLCQERSGLTLAEIGQRFGGIHYSAVSQAIRRLRQRCDEERAVSDLVNTVLSRFDP